GAYRNSFHRAVCDSLPTRRVYAQTADESGAAVADPAAVDVQLGDRAVSADGCGPDLQARRVVYASDGGAGGDLHRHRGTERGDGSYAVSAPRRMGSYRYGHRDGAGVRSAEASD